MSSGDRPTIKALIFGVTGQDGSYLAEFLLAKGYEVHGVRRRASTFNTGRINHLISDKKIWEHKFFLHYADLEDAIAVNSLILNIKPNEIYNLAAQSHVGLSFDIPMSTINVGGLGSLRILEAILRNDLAKTTKYYQASTSELFGGLKNQELDENSLMAPRSPYAVGKLMAYWLTRNYRDAYGIFAVNGILFNHESPRRGETFVTRKITRGITGIKAGILDELHLGNLDAMRDWGHAKDYVEAMWLMLQQEIPTDFVIATGQNYTVRRFVEMVCSKLCYEIQWKIEDKVEIGYDTKTGKTLVRTDAGYLRPLEVDFLLGNANRARALLGWIPKIKINSLIEEMLENDTQLWEREKSFPNINR